MLANFILPLTNSGAVRNRAVVPLHYENRGGINTAADAHTPTVTLTYGHTSKILSQTCTAKEGQSVTSEPHRGYT